MAPQHGLRRSKSPRERSSRLIQNDVAASSFSTSCTASPGPFRAGSFTSSSTTSTPTRKTNIGSRPTPTFFTPISASWLNQVEVWFSILQGQSLSGTSFTSLKQLQEHIDAYVNAHNDKAEPFVWTKKKVRQRRFKGRRITQL